MSSKYGSFEKAQDLTQFAYGENTPRNSGDFKEAKQEIPIEEALGNAGFHLGHVVCLVSVSVSVTALYTQMESVNLLGPELLCEWKLSGAEEALVTGSIFYGSAVGAFTWGKISDEMGP